MIPEMITGWNGNCFSLKDTQVHGFLAVDALSITAAVTLNSQGSISGLLENHEISEAEFDEFLSTTSKFENYLRNVSNSIIKAAFVFQFQALNPQIPSILRHIMPESSGKVNNHVLQRIRDIQFLFNQLKEIKIIGVTTDADSVFRSLVNEMIRKAESYDYKPEKIFDFPLYVSDPLHILKRYRYQLIKSIYQRNDLEEYLSIFQTALNFPTAVFSDDSLTKMHDSLPIRLYDLSSIVTAYELNMTQEFWQMIIPSLFMSSINLRNISVSERRYLMAIAGQLITGLMNQNQSHCSTPYKKILLTDTLATLMSLNSLLQTETGTISINRCTTSPLENTFGIIRLRAKYHFRLERLTSEMSKVNAMRILRKDSMEHHAIDVISKRINNFGAIVSLEKVEGFPKKLAINTPIVTDINNFIQYGIRSESLNEFMRFLRLLCPAFLPKEKKSLKSSEVVLNPSSVVNIKTRISATGIPKRSCQWSLGELNLLQKLRDDFKDNIAMISKYFPERSPTSIQKKIEAIKNQRRGK